MTEHTPDELLMLKLKNLSDPRAKVLTARIDLEGLSDPFREEAENLIEEVSLRVIERWQRSQQ